MSWSIDVVGRASAVASKVSEQLAIYKCQEPEETIKRQVGEIVVTACSTMGPNGAVRVTASGSQYTTGEISTNSLSLKIEPIYGGIVE
jgi:hypothetical protein